MNAQLHSLSFSLRRFAQRACALALPWVGLATSVHSPAEAQVPAIQITLSPSLGEALHPSVLKIHANPGDKPFLLIGPLPGSTQIAVLGEIKVALVPELMVFALPPIPASGLLELSCAPPCDSPVTLAPCFVQVVTVNPALTAFTGLSDLAVLQAAPGDCGNCVGNADNDPQYTTFNSHHALFFPGLGDDYVFVSGGTFVERANGTAFLSGVIARPGNHELRFAVDIDFTGRSSPGDANYPPVGSPKHELEASAYSENGGPVHTATWHYYESTQGTLHGQGDYAGAVLDLARIGPAFQVGFGASGKNLELGASGWLLVTVLHQPSNGPGLQPSGNGDINMRVGGDCGDCAFKAVPDPNVSTSQYTHSFYLPEIGKDFCFDPPGLFVERPDGTAQLTGTIRRTQTPTKAFDVDITFSQRVNPGAAAYPPAGSPKQSLLPNAYLENGGLIDCGTWHYYQATDGLLTGIDDYAGGVLKVTRDGPAFQVGLGANDKNLGYGASGWLIVQILQQPSFGSSFPSSLDSGDINVDLRDCP